MIARAKRVVGGEEIGRMSLAEWLDPRSLGAIEILQRAIDKWSEIQREDPSRARRMIDSIGLENILVSLCWGIVNLELEYRYDTELYKSGDFWLLPSESWFLKVGDCEDTTFLLGAALERLRELIQPTNLDFLAVCGYYHDRINNNFFGHAYIIFQHTRHEKWYVLETTWDRAPSIGAYLSWNPEVYIPAIAWNRRYHLDFNHPSARSRFQLSDSWYQKYRFQLESMRDYVLTGKRLDVPYLHKRRRPAPLNLGELEVIY